MLDNASGNHGRRGNEHLRLDGDDEPPLRPQERHPRRARAVGHRRGQLRPDVVPDGRGREPQRVELVRQRHPAAVRALPRHARANRIARPIAPRRGTTARPTTRYGCSAVVELDRVDVWDVVLDRRGRGGPCRRHVGRAGQRPDRRAIRSGRRQHPRHLQVDRQRRAADHQRRRDRSRAARQHLHPARALAVLRPDVLRQPRQARRPQGDLPPERRHPGHRRRRDLRRDHGPEQHVRDDLDHDPADRPVHRRRQLQPVPPGGPGLLAAASPGSRSTSSPTPPPAPRTTPSPPRAAPARRSASR